MAILIEGFENFSTSSSATNIPTGVSLLSGTNTLTSVLATTHVTQGTYSFNVKTVSGGNLYGFVVPSIPTSATRILIDVFVSASTSAFGAVMINDLFTSVAAKATSGSGTLVMGVSAAGVGTTFSFGVFTDNGGHAYFDNLRFADNANVTKGLINSFETVQTVSTASLPGWEFAATGAEVSSNTTWFTQGVKSLKVSTGVGITEYLYNTTPIDLTGQASLFLDYNGFESPGGEGALYLLVGTSPIDPSIGVISVSNSSGTIEIPLDPMMDLTACVITIYVIPDTTVSFDNLRYGEDTPTTYIDPDTTNFILTSFAPSTFVDLVAVELPTKALSLTEMTPAIFTDNYVELPKKSFTLTTFAVTPDTPDRFIEVPLTQFTLNKYKPEILTPDQLVELPSPVNLDLRAYPIEIVLDEYILPPTKQLDLATYAVDPFYAYVVEIPTKPLHVTTYPISIDNLYNRVFPIRTDNRFVYSIRGINASCNYGYGLIDVLVDGSVNQANIPFNTSSGNTTLSGTLGVGSDLSIRVKASNQEFRALSVEFAILRSI